MRKRPRARPRHGEHDVHRDPHRLRAMHMGEARWVRNDGIRDKGLAAEGVGVDARPPAPIEHLGDHLPLALDVAAPETLQARDQARVADHVGHQLGGVAADGEELEAGVADKLVKDIVRCEAHSVAVFLEFVAERDKGLDVASTADDLDDDVEFYGEGICF